MKSRMTGDFHVRFCERLWVRFPWPTRPDFPLAYFLLVGFAGRKYTKYGKQVMATLHAQKKCEKVQTKKEENIWDLGENEQEYLNVTGGKSGSCSKVKNQKRRSIIYSRIFPESI